MPNLEIMIISFCPIYYPFRSPLSQCTSNGYKVFLRNDSFEEDLLVFKTNYYSANSKICLILIMTHLRSRLIQWTWMISTSNQMFGRAIYDTSPERIFRNFRNCPSKIRSISKFSKMTRMICPQNYPNQTCDYWLNHTKPTTVLYWN